MNHPRLHASAVWLTPQEELSRLLLRMEMPSTDQYGTTHGPVIGDLALTDEVLEFSSDALADRLAQVLISLDLLPGASPELVREALRVTMPLGEIVLVEELPGWRRRLAVTCGDRREEFRVKPLPRWRRAIEEAAGLVPDQALSRHHRTGTVPGEASLSAVQPDRDEPATG